MYVRAQDKALANIMKAQHRFKIEQFLPWEYMASS